MEDTRKFQKNIDRSLEENCGKRWNFLKEEKNVPEDSWKVWIYNHSYMKEVWN